MAPENGWLEYDRFLLGPGLFSGASVGGRNPKQPPEMYKNLVNNGINLPFPQLVSGSRISGQPINVVFWKLSGFGYTPLPTMWKEIAQEALQKLVTNQVEYNRSLDVRWMESQLDGMESKMGVLPPTVL